MNASIKLLLPLAFVTIGASTEIVVSINTIAGKTQTEVAAVLGQPSTCEPSKFGQRCYYAKGETEVVFIAGKADWITIEALDQYPFSESALAALGLKPTEPTFRSASVLRWTNIPGLREVSLFRGQTKADYAYIKVKTE